MRRDLLRSTRTLVLPTLALVVVLAFVPGEGALAARIYALFVCVLAFLVALAVLRRALPAARPLHARATKKAQKRTVPETLERIEQETLLGVASSFDLQYRFVPRLRTITAGLLASRRRVELDTDLDAGRSILGDETWELVRPSRPPPADRIGRGIAPGRLSEVVDTLEAI